ncbi:Glucosyltransferase [Heracleum sosnowskyi]|uniref:Glucosyltransferase n=1 Tax=Heracleum sosnowskyi TaxID=360622 RepID=A0AAD8IQI9_9APIA|nr:Glucosyltransferase [Heracleum sosnowskyi]
MARAQEVTKPHIAFLPSPGIGHLVPLLEFAKHLVIHHNVHVSFLVMNTQKEAPVVQQQLLHPSTLPADLHVIDLPPVNISSCVDSETSVVTQLMYICQESIKHLGATLTELNLPKALIIDIFTTDAFFVCKELGIPVYSFFTSTTELLALSFYLPKLDKECVELPELQVPGCKSIDRDDHPANLLKMKDDMIKLTMVTGIFVNTWDDLESKSCGLAALK